MKEWMQNDFARMFPDRLKSRTPSTPPSRVPQVLTPPPTHDSAQPKLISNDDIAQFLGHPNTLVGKQFVHSPPEDQDQSDRGTWEVISYSVRKGENGVECEYVVSLEAVGGDSLPMCEEEVRSLLAYSTFAA